MPAVERAARESASVRAIGVPRTAEYKNEYENEYKKIQMSMRMRIRR